LPENKHFVEINSKETLAQVFTDIRYTRKDNESMSATLLTTLAQQKFLKAENLPGIIPAVTERRPDVLECDVVRFQNKKEKWVAFVGLLDGFPYEIFTGLQDDEEGIAIPKSVQKGFILKHYDRDGQKRYDFQFINKRGYKTTIEGLSERFNPEYWDYAKLISGVLRYRMPIDHVIRLITSLQLENDTINSWTAGVAPVLKKYLPDSSQTFDEEETE
jgi:ribonucleoside-diphosphate reductase alpha chain